MAPFQKVQQLSFDLLSIGQSLSDIKELDIRELNHWAEVKRQMDEAERRTGEKMENARKN